MCLKILRQEDICHLAQNKTGFQLDYGGHFLLTLHGKNGKFIKINAMKKPSKRTHPTTRELPFGARQQEDRAEYLSERLC